MLLFALAAEVPAVRMLLLASAAEQSIAVYRCKLNEHDIHSLAGSVAAAEDPGTVPQLHQSVDEHSGIVLISQSCSSGSSSYRIPGDAAHARWRIRAPKMRLCVHGVAFALSPSCSRTALPS
jgi:hypothetical protein